MRILSVVTLVSPQGEYGGPLRVAVNQADVLQERGHEVTIAAAHRGYGSSPPHELEGIPARLFPGRHVVPRTGVAGLASPGLARYVHQHASTFDVAHVHVARDLVTLPATLLLRRQRVPYVLQPHGMINASRHPLARLMDPLLTVPALRHAGQLLYLTSTERGDLEEIVGAGDPALVRLANGVPVSPLVADPTVPEILFLARMAPRKRPQMMVELAEALRADFPAHRVRLVGPDEGEAPAVAAASQAAAADVRWEGALRPDQTLERMSRAGVYVLPSVDEPYGMSVLEAMSVGLPVVITDTCGLASLVTSTGSGVVTGPELESLVEGVRSILSDPERARRMGEAGRRAVEERLSMAAIGDKLEEIYGAARSLAG